MSTHIVFIFIHIMHNSHLIDLFKKEVGTHIPFSTRELTNFLQNKLPELHESTIGWRINQLKNEGFIFQVGRGVYSFEEKPEYQPNLSLKSKRLYNRIIRLIPDKRISIWELEMLNEFCENKNHPNYVFISTSKDELESLFNEMMGFSKKVFLNPDSTILNRYVLPLEDAIILLPLVSEAPLLELKNTWIPSLEGLLVDAFVNNELILKPAGYSLEEIFKKALEKYHVNQSKLFRYAARRDKRNEIENYIHNL